MDTPIHTPIHTLAHRIRNTPSLAEKTSLLIEMGNARYDRYKATNDPKEKQLATNCYLGARELFWKYGPAQKPLGIGIPYN
jgi:hypothetical protein